MPADFKKFRDLFSKAVKKEIKARRKGKAGKHIKKLLKDYGRAMDKAHSDEQRSALKKHIAKLEEEKD